MRNYATGILDDGTVVYGIPKDKGTLEVIGNDVTVKKMTCNIETGEVEYDLMFQNSNAPPMTASVAADNLVKALESHGYLIPNENVGNLKEHITEQAQKLTPTNVYKRVGWELDSNGELCFKGYTLHSNTGFKARYKGNLDIQPQGTKDGFVKDVQEHILGHPTLELSMLLGLSSCLVGYLNCFTTMNTIVVNIYGCSTTGKTTSCNLAVSMCGNHFPGNNKQSLSSTWYGTENGKAAELAGNQGFTVLFDEFGMVDRKLDLSQFIYGLHSGKGKARATRTGDSATPRRWATTVLSSGEHSIFDTSTTADGLKVRVLNFGSITWTDSAEQAHEVDKFSRKYCALPIHLLADYLLTLDSSSVLERYHKLLDNLIPELETDQRYKERTAQMVAVLMLTGDLFQECFSVELDTVSIKKIILDSVRLNTPEAEALRAYEHIMQMVQLNRNKFSNRLGKKTKDPNLRQPYINYIGVVLDKDLSVSGLERHKQSSKLILTCKIFETWMEDGNYSNIDNILHEWRDKYNVLIAKDKTRFKVKSRINDGDPPVECIALKILHPKEKLCLSERTEPPRILPLEFFIRIKIREMIDKKYPSCFSSYTLENVNKMIRNDPEEFLNKYCNISIDFNTIDLDYPEPVIEDIDDLLKQLESEI